MAAIDRQHPHLGSTTATSGSRIVAYHDKNTRHYYTATSYPRRKFPSVRKRQLISSHFEPLYLQIKQIIAHILGTSFIVFFVLISYTEDVLMLRRSLVDSLYQVFRKVWGILFGNQREHHIPNHLPSHSRQCTPQKSQSVRRFKRIDKPHTRHYIENIHGYRMEEYEIITKDGFILKLDRILPKNRTSISKGPMILMHGLFQSGGVFVTSGEKSMAFYFTDLGYDVWIPNNRCVFTKKPHVEYSANDQKLWEWSLEHLATYDFPAIVDYVYDHGLPKGSSFEMMATSSIRQRDAKFPKESRKVIFIGHSQGNAQAFHGLHDTPSISEKIKCFVALAPAVYVGDLLSKFPVCLLMNCSGWAYKLIFGVKQFIPIMSFAQNYIPTPVFTYFAFRMFSYLFGWTDTNWNVEFKDSYFRFTPRPTSAQAIYHWGQVAQLELGTRQFTRSRQPKKFKVENIKCPIILFCGGKDRIVNGDKIIEECTQRHDNLIHVDRIEHYEHLDFLWGRDASERVWSPIDALMDHIN